MGKDEPVTTQRSVTLLGSTGSIGTQAIDVAVRNPERFRITGLAAGGAQLDLLARQAVELGVEVVAVAEGSADEVRAALERARRDRVGALRAGGAAAAAALAATAGFGRMGGAMAHTLAGVAAAAEEGRSEPEILVGPDAATELAGRPADVVLNGITGSIGLRPTLAALAAGSTLALANKESLIVGGDIVTAAAKPGQIVPVDSEHSALAQCLRGGSADEVRRLVVTASGGPFRGRSRAELTDVTPEQALAHPTWDMGRVVTTNSATLVNKGLEVIEAHLLFDIPFDRIAVTVHPQSIVHSMVEFTDGSTLAQASPPDMRLPIALGMGWPDRVPEAAPACDWTTASTWEFFPLDEEAFPAVALARRVGVEGGTYPAVYNAANEVCVDAFHDRVIGFLEIVDTVARVVDDWDAGVARGENKSAAEDVEDVLAADRWARVRAAEIIG